MFWFFSLKRSCFFSKQRTKKQLTSNKFFYQRTTINHNNSSSFLFENLSLLRRNSSFPNHRQKKDFLPTIDLSTLTSSEGSVVFGAAAGDINGTSVSSAGDFNNDGIANVISVLSLQILLEELMQEQVILFMEKLEDIS
jgi:hypothetical protein